MNEEKQTQEEVATHQVEGAAETEPSEAPTTTEPAAVSAIAESAEAQATPEPTEVSATVEPSEAPTTPEPTEVSATVEPSEVPATAEPAAVSATAEPSEAPATAEPSVEEPAVAEAESAPAARPELPPPPVLSGLIGRKLGMTHIFDGEGRMVPVTVLQVGPCYVVQVRTPERDGYHAAQIGFERIARRKLTKPLAGIFKKAGLGQPLRYLKEFRVLSGQAVPGQEIRPEHVFASGEVVRVTGVSKGKGFAGVVKRYGFAGGPKTHGSMTHRRPLSSGATGPQRVFKNKTMPGRMGGERVTVRGLTIVRIEPEHHLILVKGAIPGGRGSIVYVQKQLNSTQ
jgi:large subunit ribosomal protein L3